LRAAPNFVFLRAFAGLGIKKTTLLVNANTGLFCFKSSYLLEFSLMCDFCRLKLRFNFGATHLFHCVHAVEFFLDALQFFFADAPPRFFGRAFARFGFDAELLLLSAS